MLHMCFPRETRGGPISYTCVNSILHAGALRTTRTCDCVRGRAHTRVVNQHLGVVNFSEHEDYGVGRHTKVNARFDG